MNPAVAALVEACSAERTLAEVVDQVAQQVQPAPPPEALLEQCLALCAQLAQRGVLTLQTA